MKNIIPIYKFYPNAPNNLFGWALSDFASQRRVSAIRMHSDGRFRIPRAVRRGLRYSDAGFTLTEIVIVIGILVLMFGLAISFYKDFQKKIEVSLNAEEIESVLRQSQSQSMAVKDGLKHGVYFDIDNNQYIMFEGDVFIPSPEDKNYSLSKGVEFESINLSGGSDCLIFEKLTGTAVNYGTIKIRSKKDNSLSKTIIITNEGKISIQ